MTKVEYISCPLCGFSHVTMSAKRQAKGKSAQFQWATFDIQHGHLVQVREALGKKGSGKKGRGQGAGAGFVLTQEFSVDDIWRNPAQYGNVLDEMKNHLIKIVKDSIKLGIMTIKDVTP